MPEREEPLKSPCTSACEIDLGTGACATCLRTMDEIVNWPSLTNDRRRAILDRLEARKK